MDSRNRNYYSQIATDILGVKAADQNSQEVIEDIKIIRRHAELNVAHCVLFFVKNVKKLQDTAIKEGYASYETEQGYLRGY